MINERFGTAYVGPEVVSGATILLTCRSVLSIWSNVTEFASFRLALAYQNNRSKVLTVSAALADQFL